MHRRIHSAAEASQAQWTGRVPSGQGFYSLHVRLAAVQITYMQRFINELVQYLLGGCGLGAHAASPGHGPCWRGALQGGLLPHAQPRLLNTGDAHLVSRESLS